MKIKTFLLTFASFMVLLVVSAILIFIQMKAIKGIHLEVLEDKLYTENTGILAWAMDNAQLDKLDQSKMPASWGEIIVVDNTSLAIKSSTVKEHAGMSLSTIPQILDQANPVLEAVKKAERTQVKTKDYMIAVNPLPENSTLIGFKPKSWERALISDQNNQIIESSKSMTTTLIFYLAGGTIFAVVLSFLITILIIKPMDNAAKAFEQLSMGDFDTEMQRKNGSTFESLSDSFFRLKTSLKYALDKLGS